MQRPSSWPASPSNSQSWRLHRTPSLCRAEDAQDDRGPNGPWHRTRTDRSCCNLAAKEPTCVLPVGRRMALSAANRVHSLTCLQCATFRDVQECKDYTQVPRVPVRSGRFRRSSMSLRTAHTYNIAERELCTNIRVTAT